METLTGSVDRVVYQSPDSGYVIARLKVQGVNGQGTLETLETVVGQLGKLAEGEVLRMGGQWDTHPKHGRQFAAAWVEQRLPATTDGIEKFLASGVIKGVGAGTAQAVVEAFGEETIDVLDNHPERVKTVPNVSKKRAETLINGWRGHIQAREILLFFRSHDLPMQVAKRVYEKYGDQSVAVIQQDPYKLVLEVQGVGFKTADSVALRLGLDAQSPSRVIAATMHVLEEAARDGHVYLPKPALVVRTANLLDVPAILVEATLLEASRQHYIMIDGEAVYLAHYYASERNAARGVRRLQTRPSFLFSRTLRLDPAEAMDDAVKRLGVTLAPRQIEAVTMALTDKVSIVTGGPGTGKTMCLHVLIAALDRAGLPYSLCAPTGRAAKRMAAVTKRGASTIHRLLGFQPASNDFSFNADHPLPDQYIIVDEVSMIDIILFNHLLKAISDGSHLLLVGDSDQLPAVGAGNVLADLLECGQIPSVMLNELFRQVEGSQITVAAHQIRRGEVPASIPDSDLYLIRVPDAERAQAIVIEMVSQRIPAKFKFDPFLDIQVLSPTHRGPAGIAALNQELQGRLNPATEKAPEIGLGAVKLRVGDKVMQVRNNYDKDVYNGDVGLVEAIDTEEQMLSVRFDESGESHRVEYEATELGDLMLAYAVSVHKSQGSEFPCVVLPLLSSHFPLLQRSLLYTAITRAKQLCILIYQPKALQVAVSAERHEERFSGLADRLIRAAADDAEDASAEPFEIC